MFSVFVAVAFAAPQGYRLGEPGGPAFSVRHSTHGEVNHSDSITTTSQGTPLTDDGLSTDAIYLDNEQARFEILPISNASTGTSTITETLDEGEDNTEISADSDSGLSTRADNASDGELERKCPEGEIRHIDGSCVVPEITRKIFVFSVPKQPRVDNASFPSLPPPRVDHNVLFVRLPEGGAAPEPIVVPPPRQESIIYVLNKQEEQTQRVIEVPAQPPSEPEIYFVNYEEGDNPTLPGGFDLYTALSSATKTSGRSEGNAVTLGSGTDEKHGNVDISNSEEHFDGTTGVVIVHPGPEENLVTSTTAQSLGLPSDTVNVGGNENVSSAQSVPDVAKSDVDGLYQTP